MRIVPQSGLVIMLEELVAVVAENLRLRGDMAERTESWPRCPAGSRRWRPRWKEGEGGRVVRREDQDARGKARRGERAGRDERIRMLEPTGPPWTATARGSPQATGATTALTPRREAARGLPSTAGERRSRRAMRGRQSGGRRAGAGGTSARRASWTQTALTSTAAAPSSTASATVPACPSVTRSSSSKWPTLKRSSFRAGTS